MADEQDGKRDEAPCAEVDSMSLGPEMGGVRPFVRHCADHSIEVGVALVADPAKPPPEGSLHLKHREGTIYDVHTAPPSISSKGPAKVTSAAYRSNYDNIFGNKTTVGQA